MIYSYLQLYNRRAPFIDWSKLFKSKSHVLQMLGTVYYAENEKEDRENN